MVALRRRAARLGVMVTFGLGICWVGRSDQAVEQPDVAGPHVVLSEFSTDTGDASLGPGVDQEQLQKDCDFGFLPVRPTVGIGSLIGTAWAQCDVPPDSHVMVVGLQRLQGGWQTIASSPPDRQIPPGPPQRAAYQIKTVCAPGAWRVNATATGSLQGRTASLTDYSLERLVSQQDCDRGK
jgi:hypothetical protein